VSTRVFAFPVHVRDPVSFWTSGSADGEYCGEEQVYGWCSNGTRVKIQEITLPWADANPPELNQSCLSLNLNNSQFSLKNVECTAQKFVLCEVNWILLFRVLFYENNLQPMCSSPVCPATCNTNVIFGNYLALILMVQ
jgi:hypothetical protein